MNENVAHYHFAKSGLLRRCQH